LNVLRNFVKIRSQFIVCLLVVISQPAHASDATEQSLLPVALSLLAVVALIFVIAAVMRRINVMGHGSKQMQVVASMMVGTRERVVVIEVAGEQHMLGITATQINHLSRLQNPISLEQQGQQDQSMPNFLAKNGFNKKRKGTHE
jgi:flagellar protein FliO/FliZ